MYSIWEERNKTDFSNHPRLEGDVRTDVLIIGGGLAGVLCAHRLHAAGVSCVLAEAESVCSGVSAGSTAKVTSQHRLLYTKLAEQRGFESAKCYFQMQEDAIRSIRRLCHEKNCPFEERDMIVYDHSDSKKLEKEADIIERMGGSAEVVGDTELPIVIAGALKRPGQGQMDPFLFTRAVAENLSVYEHTAVRRIEGMRAVTDRGSITASCIVIATHFPFVNRHGSYFMKMYQSRSYVLGVAGVSPIRGMYVDADEKGLSFRMADDVLLIGGGAHRTGTPSEAWKPCEDFARRHYPDAPVRARWATQDCMTLDGLPYVGKYSLGCGEWYVATGFCKWGMTSSMVAATVLADMIQGKTREEYSLFSPSRCMLHPQLAVNAWESATSLLKCGKKRCPHLGCALEWNPHEHSWDCPCHGSRFREDGTVIDNPAIKPLKK